MDLVSSHPYGRVENGTLHSYPPLADDCACDVAVVGAGITGALVAERLSRTGRKVVVLDRRDAASGSTSASTSLLQYEIDVMLVDLSQKIGRSAAERAYALSYRAVDRLEEVSDRAASDCGFARKLSLYVASSPRDVGQLEAEAAARRHCGFDVRLLSEGELRTEFGLRYPAALASSQAASVDAYRLTDSLLQLVLAAGGAVFDRTRVVRYQPAGRGVRLFTDRGPVVEAEAVVIATGYEAQDMLREKIVRLKSTYALVTQPLESLEPWNERWIMWETKRPYLYLRAAPGNRLLAGGEDDDFSDPVRRDQRLPGKTQRLMTRLGELFPGIAATVDYAWAGTFGETRDGLPYIGLSPEYPKCWFALGFGGNGITFSAIAADLVCQALDGRPPADLELFRFGR